MTRRVNRPFGRPRKEAPPHAAARIQALAATGHSVVGIARGLNTSKEVLRRWIDEDPALEEAFAQGREAERLALHNVLYVQATKHHNIVAAMFLLKARHGYREGDQSDTANKVQINFTLPAAMNADQFKVIENEPTSSPLPLPAARTTRA
jgi:hypothetical protein